MTTIRFTIPGRLAGKGRPRAVQIGGFVRLLTPAKTRSVEGMVRDIASKAMQGRVALEGPIGLDVLVVQTPAASWSKKRKAAAHWVTGRPDCDNVQKLICDSLNNIIWLDDAQVSAIHFERVYSLTQPEHVEVTVHALGESPWTR